MTGDPLDKALSATGLKPERPVFWAPSGSRLYGLETPSSDCDLTLVTEGGRRDSQRQSAEYDVHVAPLRLFLGRALDSQPNEVDILHSHELHMLGAAYAPLISGLRFEANRYVWRQEAHAVRWLRIIARDGKNERRRMKYLRTVLRNLSLSLRLRRAEAQGRPFDVHFAPAQRIVLFAVLDGAMSEFAHFDGSDEAMLAAAYRYAYLIEEVA
jgi:hypothetical protein